MPLTQDRITALRARAEDFTGIDFVQVVDSCEQTVLRIYFLTDPRDLRPPFEDLGLADVVAEPLTLPDLSILSADGGAPDVELVPCPAAEGEVLPPPTGIRWGQDDLVDRRYLEICTAEPGTFTDYRLAIDDPRLDGAFNSVRFSFKAGCDRGLDCKPPDNPCPDEPPVDATIDYLARDFTSFRNALLDFAAQRYPNWQLPTESDQAVMLLEVMAALGDEFSYIQDRHNREAYLETATERRSLRRKARLMDHEIHDGRMASTILELTVSAATLSVPIGAPVWVRATGNVLIPFELGTGMRDPDTDFLVEAVWNAGQFVPYCFVDEDECLAVGATEIVVENPGIFDATSAAIWSAGRLLLLRDVPQDASETERLHLVRVTSVELFRDELMNQELARITWGEEDAVNYPMALATLDLSGNIVQATAGARRTVFYRLGPLSAGDAAMGVLRAVERAGPLFGLVDDCDLDDDPQTEAAGLSEPDRPPIYLLSLPETDENGLAFADPLNDLRRSLPEIDVYTVGTIADAPVDPFTYRRSLVFDSSDDEVFTLEDGTWRRILSHVRHGEELVHQDYATGAGYSVRLGDGEFGQLPAPDGLIRVDYRLGFGSRANVPAQSVNLLAADGLVSPLAALVDAASNPFAVEDGVDPESHADVRLLTPEAYRGSRLFAVRPEDYGEQAEMLDFVQRAQGSFRWTGSWLSAITTVDPEDSFTLSEDRRDAVEALLEQRRQAGREVIVRPPRYVDLDLIVTLCAAPFAYPAQLRTRVADALVGQKPGAFFDPDNFTFGTALRRSALEAAIMNVAGVVAVLGIQLRIVGETDFRPFTDLVFEVADDRVIRLANDPRQPEQGSLTLLIEGGA